MYQVNTNETKNGKVIRAHGGKGIARAYAKTSAKASESREENHRYAAEKAISQMLDDEIRKGYRAIGFRIVSSTEALLGFTHDVEFFDAKA